MKIKINCDGSEEYLKEWGIEKIVYPSGFEYNARIFAYTFGSKLMQETKGLDYELVLCTECNTFEKMMFTFCLKDAIKNMYGERFPGVSLFIPFLPNSRQDKIVFKFESDSNYVFQSIIRSFEPLKFYTLDIHNENAATYITPEKGSDFVNIIPNFSKEEWKDYVIVAPDKGARARARKVCVDLGKNHRDTNHFIFFDKIRNKETGKIESLECMSIKGLNLKGKTFLIIDDICDGGKTFSEIGRILKERNAEKVILHVTHGLFTKGLPIPFVDEVVTYSYEQKLNFLK